MVAEAFSAAAALTYLNIGLAACVTALLLAFVTPARTAESLANIRRIPGRWRRGVLLILLGEAVIAPSLAPGLLTGGVRDWVNLAAYPLYYAGIIMMASATWGAPFPPASPAELPPSTPEVPR